MPVKASARWPGLKKSDGKGPNVRLHLRFLLRAVHLQAEQKQQGSAAAAAARQMHQQGGPDLVPEGSNALSDEAAAAAEAEVDPFGDFLEGLEGASGDLESQLAKLEQEEEVKFDSLHMQRTAALQR